MIVTNWGYTLIDTESLPDLITMEELNTLTGNKYAGDVRLSPEIAAACAAIRNYCGWHISPSLECVMPEYLLYGDGRVKRVGGRDLLIQLPAKFVTAVESVKIDDVAHEDFVVDTDGLLHVFDVDFCRASRKTKVTVAYTAGVPDTDLSAVRELVAHRVTHAMAVPPGITSEAAGGVSVTYNANWSNSTRATALPDDNKEVLAPYRLQGVF